MSFGSKNLLYWELFGDILPDGDIQKWQEQGISITFKVGLMTSGIIVSNLTASVLKTEDLLNYDAQMHYSNQQGKLVDASYILSARSPYSISVEAIINDEDNPAEQVYLMNFGENHFSYARQPGKPWLVPTTVQTDLVRDVNLTTRLASHYIQVAASQLPR